MRRLAAALALFGLVADASAGEFEIPELPTLRGSSPFIPAAPTYTRWSGFYAGAQAGYGSAHFDFSAATRSLIAFELRELALENEQHPSSWPVLGLIDTGGGSVGGFAGFNTQWDDVILGLDVNYSRTRFSATAPTFPIGRLVSAGGNTYAVTIDGAASMNISDWGSARLRAGYVINNVLPYATFGMAVGRADLTRSATAVGFENPTVPPIPCDSSASPPCTPFSFSGSEVRHNAFIFGWAAGGGVDLMLMPHVFVRGEYEYVSFAGVSGIKASISTARIGGAFKF